MSRTKRRTQKHLIAERFGNLSQFLQDNYYKAPIMSGRVKQWNMGFSWNEGFFVANGYVTRKYHGCMAVQVYQKKVAAFTGDTRSGLHGVPRWYRNLHGARPIRRNERAKLHRHLREDCWESHLPDSRFRNSKYYWW